MDDSTLEDIWDLPVTPASPARAQKENDLNESGRSSNRSSLFLPDSDDENPVPAASSSTRPNIDALFAEVENDPDTEIITLPDSLDLDALRRAADAKHARMNGTLTPHAILPSSSPPRDTGDADNRQGQKEEEGKKERRRLPRLDEGRLLGPNGFPQLIKDTKNFKPRGKGHEVSDLNRLLQIYQFWTHKLYPKTQFRDTVERIEKICHSNRMHVSLSVWRDEAHGIVNGKNNKENDTDADSDVEIATSTGNAADKPDGTSLTNSEHEDHNSSSSSGAPSAPPSSSSGNDDDFDIEAIIREEEELAAAIAKQSNNVTNAAQPKAVYREKTVASHMTIDDEDDAMWDELHLFEEQSKQVTKAGRSRSARELVKPVSPEDEDEEMWDVVREIETNPVTKPIFDKETPTETPMEDQSAVTHIDAGPAAMEEQAEDDDWDDMYLN